MHRLYATVGLTFLLASFASPNAARVARDQGVEPGGWPYMQLVAENSLGHRLEIATEAGIPNHAVAVLIIGDQTWRFTDLDCPPFRAALDAFQTLPPLKPGPALLQPGASRERPMPPYRPHGELWTIRTQLYAPDWSSMDVEMRGSQGPYAFWLTDTVAAIQRCTPPPLRRSRSHRP
ncbi:hypothetical protein [Brevundimonas balnearis]|uniref:Uncharacterized protein n=1 Tax=Brevundimonas balnearis TaxID=1572858 RepID=A0ABV6R215_9CAUL